MLAHNFYISAVQGHSPEVPLPVYVVKAASTKDKKVVGIRVRNLLAKRNRGVSTPTPLQHIDVSSMFLSKQVLLVKEPRAVRGVRLKTPSAWSRQIFAFLTHCWVVNSEIYLRVVVEISVKPVSGCRRSPPMKQFSTLGFAIAVAGTFPVSAMSSIGKRAPSSFSMVGFSVPEICTAHPVEGSCNKMPKRKEDAFILKHLRKQA